MNLLQATEDPALFGPWFRDRATWQPWFAFIAALFALPMTIEQYALYRRHTGRDDAPLEPHHEAWLCCGRRGGKTFAMSLIACFLACFRDYRPYLQPGERATVGVIAAHRKQARLIIRYMAAMLEHIPMLQEMVEAPRADGFDLNNQVTIEVGVASFRSTRGYAYAGVLADEIAYWRTDEHSAEPDEEVLAAIRPGMAQIPGSMLICASSPYARQGTLWNAYRKYWGDAEAPLVWKATTREMNPTFPQATVNKALADDYAKASAEYLAEFRSDVEGFVTLEVVEGCVINGVIERGPISGVSYEAFCDPSGGSSDSFTLAVGHRDGDRVVVDAVRERIPPFSPEQVVDEFAATLRRYGVHNVSGDRYGGDFPRELFRKRNISYELAEQTCSDNFRDLLPLLNSETIELLDSPRLLSQLVGLERRTSRSGRDQISHRPSAHDDVAASVAGLARMLARTSTYTLDHVV